MLRLIPFIRACCLLVVLFTTGCSTHAHRLAQYRDDFYSGHLDNAQLTLDKLIEDRPQDETVFKLDRAFVQLTNGQTEPAEKTLREVRDKLDFYQQRDIRDEVLSVIDDETRRAYAGSDYERILVRVMLTVTNLMNGGDDAIAYALQIGEEQQEVLAKLEKNNPEQEEEKPIDVPMVAVGPYLHAALLEERHTDFDDIERSRLKVVSWEQGFRDGEADLKRAQFGRLSQPGNGVVYVIAMVGRGPHKVEAVEAPTTISLLIADRILSHVFQQELPPTIAPVKVPKVVRGRSEIDAIQVIANDQKLGTTATIMDVSDFAIRQSEAEFPHVLARAVVRRVVKKGAIYAVKDNVNADQSPAVDFALSAAGVIWEATENADTRCWGLIPDQIQVLRFELPAGQQTIRLQPERHNLPIGAGQSVTLEVQDGRNAYVMALVPDQHILGKVLVSH